MEKQDIKIIEPVKVDARKSLRKNLHIDCIVTTDQFLAPACLLDISIGGAFIQCNKVIDPGLEITLILILPSQNTLTELSIRAIVVHAGRFIQGYDNFTGFGVRFKNLSKDVKLKLKDILLVEENQSERKYLLY